MIENWDQYKDLEYYPDRFCKHGCGGRIKVQPHHKYQGIPEYIHGHNAVSKLLIPREIRTCVAPGCDITFECKVNSKRKYCCGGHSRIGKPGPNTGKHFSAEHCKKIGSSLKGKSSPKKGKTYKEIYGDKAVEVAGKISESNTGKKHSEETRQKQRKAKLGTKHSEETKKKRIETRKNNGEPWHTNKTIEKMSISRTKYLEEHPDAMKGENGPNWQGGLSFIEYPSDFNEELKILIRERDNNICQLCGSVDDLNIHHIDYVKENCDETNLITLCRSCNSKVNFNRDYWIEFFQQKMKLLELVA